MATHYALDAQKNTCLISKPIIIPKHCTVYQTSNLKDTDIITTLKPQYVGKHNVVNS